MEALNETPESAQSETSAGTPSTPSPAPHPPSDADYRAAFGAWLRGFAAEARELCAPLAREDAPEPLRRFAAETLNQWLHTVDLVPEGIEGLGYLETLFGFRLLARELWEAAPDSASADPSGAVQRCASEAELVRFFLGEEDHERLAALVRAQREQRVRGRSVTELLEAPEAREAAIEEAQSWAERYRPPQFGAGSHDLVRLQSFLRTRVRRAH